ncbi:pyridoxal-phosphate dependent enzyme [Streptomyces sp. NPDC058049]|uniref:pyridoxal-phosphate dependent enzyme n=1 Tax=Streptomyces sp. NPDC058049 TaxID=3346314 RepID=UPI0036DFE661
MGHAWTRETLEISTGIEIPQLTRIDIDRAAERLTGRVWRTPVIRSDHLDALSGARLWLKAENLQRGGSFKIRGALLAVGRLAARGSRARHVRHRLSTTKVIDSESFTPENLPLPLFRQASSPKIYACSLVRPKSQIPAAVLSEWRRSVTTTKQITGLRSPPND